MPEFWALPVGMFLDAIACWEIMNGAEEDFSTSAERPPGAANDNDLSILDLK